jgi:hypothetical protein
MVLQFLLNAGPADAMRLLRQVLPGLCLDELIAYG